MIDHPITIPRVIITIVLVSRERVDHRQSQISGTLQVRTIGRARPFKRIEHPQCLHILDKIPLRLLQRPRNTALDNKITLKSRSNSLFERIKVQNRITPQRHPPNMKL